MREIGGFLELEKNQGREFHENCIALNSGRNCLRYLIRARPIKKIWLPKLLCSAISDVCKEEKVEMVSISFLVLRKKMANEPRPYKVKHFKFVGVMAIFMAGFMVLVYIFPWFGCNLVKQEWIIIGGWGTLGIIFSAICKMVYKDKYGVML